MGHNGEQAKYWGEGFSVCLSLRRISEVQASLLHPTRTFGVGPLDPWQWISTSSAFYRLMVKQGRLGLSPGNLDFWEKKEKKMI